jgi:hypothetical protein
MEGDGGARWVDREREKGKRSERVKQKNERRELSLSSGLRKESEGKTIFFFLSLKGKKNASAFSLKKKTAVEFLLFRLRVPL